MAFEHKPNSGSLFTNDRKERDSQPDWNGSCKIGDTEYWVAAWENEGSKGLYFSLKFTVKEDTANVRRPPGREAAAPAPSGFAARREAAIQNARSKLADMKTRAAGDGPDFSDDDIPF